MKPPDRPASAVAFCAAAAAASLPPAEAATLRALCKAARLTPDALAHLLHALKLPDPHFADALFALASVAPADTVPRPTLLIVYAVLRRLAFATGDPARAAAQEAVWLAFCAAAGRIDASTVSWHAWISFLGRLGEAVGGIQSLPCPQSVDNMRKAWKKARPPFRDALTFEKLVQSLRLYDAGLVKCLRAMGYILACAVIDAGNAPVEKPIWTGDQHDVFFGQFLTHAIGKAASKSTLTSSDCSNPIIPDLVVDTVRADTTPPCDTLLKRPDRQFASRSRPSVIFGIPDSASTVRNLSENSSPTSVLPNAPNTVKAVRRTANATGKTPFHIDFSSLDLGERIGSGAYGDVYRGTFLMSPVAVKMFHVNLERKREDHQDPSQLNRMSTMSALQRFASATSQAKFRNFVREVEMMSVVRHPNLVLYMGACGDPNTPLCIVSELFTGGSLFDFLHGDEAFTPPVEMAVNFGLNIARGMFYLHSSQPSILHRDLKSRNVLLSGRKNEHDGIPHVVICDFGLCQLFGEEGHSTSQMGTASYMSPLVINGEKYEAADDVYSYGILLHEIFTGRVPYEGMRAVQVMYQVSNDDLRPVFMEGDHVPTNVRKLIKQCWHKERARRPDFAEIIERLDEIEADVMSCNAPQQGVGM